MLGISQYTVKLLGLLVVNWSNQILSDQLTTMGSLKLRKRERRGSGSRSNGAQKQWSAEAVERKGSGSVEGMDAKAAGVHKQRERKGSRSAYAAGAQRQ